MLQVFLLDDHAIIREGVKVLLGGDPAMSVIGEAGSVRESESCWDVVLKADVVVLDLFLEEHDSGLAIVKRLMAVPGHPAIIVLSMFTNAALVKECLAMGVSAYVTKGDAAQYLPQAIRIVADGKKFISPSILGAVLEPTGPGDNPSALERLTLRERDILYLVGKGYTTRRICNQLSISASTVGTHIENIKDKLGINDKNSLVRFAVRLEQERFQQGPKFSPQ